MISQGQATLRAAVLVAIAGTCAVGYLVLARSARGSDELAPAPASRSAAPIDPSGAASSVPASTRVPLPAEPPQTRARVLADLETAAIPAGSVRGRVLQGMRALPGLLLSIAECADCGPWTAISESDGTFVLREVPVGLRFLTWNGNPGEPAPPDPVTMPVEISAGGTTVVEFVLPPAESSELRGYVRLDGQAPVHGELFARRVREDGVAEPVACARAAIATGGTYRFPVLPLGSYELEVRAQDRFGRMQTALVASVIMGQQGHFQSIELRFGCLRGRIWDPTTGRGRANLALVVLIESRDGWAVARPFGDDSVRTGVDGSYHIDALPAGVYRIHFVAGDALDTRAPPLASSDPLILGAGQDLWVGDTFLVPAKLVPPVVRADCGK